MTILPIITIPDPVLRKISDPVERVDDAVVKLMDDMLETMYDAPGIGLAAVQVGVAQRVLVIDLQEREGDAPDADCDDDDCGHDHRPVKRTPRVFINPEITDPSEDMSVYSEGCLSVPDIYADVERPARVRVRWQDETGAAHEEAMEGLMATCIQHEMDHLEGVLFIDRLSRLKRQIALRKLEKARRVA